VTSTALTAKYQQFSELLGQSQRISIIIHEKPDGDAIGSASALFFAFKKKEVNLLCNTDIPAVFSKIIPVNFSKEFIEADLYIVLDCNSHKRTGFEKELIDALGKQAVVLIDHHVPTTLAKKATLAIIDRESVATCEMINNYLECLKIEIRKNTATSLLLGLYTDTGGFQHPNTTSEALKLASSLVNKGGDLELITSKLSERKRNITKTKLWGKALENMKVNKYGMAIATISHKQLDETNATPEEAMGLVNLLSQIDNVKLALVFVENGEGWRASVRTNNKKINIEQFAALFGGHGTKKAAGFTVTENLI